MSAQVLLDRERLAKLLGPLGSEHDGEIVAAGRAADRLVRAAGLTWPDVILQPSLPTPPPDPTRQRNTLARIVDKLRARAEAA